MGELDADTSSNSAGITTSAVSKANDQSRTHGRAVSKANDQSRTNRQQTGSINLFVYALIYCISIAGNLLALNALTTSPSGFSRTTELLIFVFLSLIPVFFLVSTSIETVRLISDLKQKAWGSRLQLRVALVFFLLLFTASVPAGLLLELSLYKSMERPIQTTVKTALSSSLQALSVAIEDENRQLQKTALYDVYPAAVKGSFVNAQDLLAYIQERSESVIGVDFVLDNGESLDYAGREDSRLIRTVLSQNGYLGKYAQGKETWGHYFLYHVFETRKTGSPRWVNIIITKLYNQTYAEAAVAVTAARKSMQTEIGILGSVKSFLIFFSVIFLLELTGISLVFALYAGNILVKPLTSIHSVIQDIEHGNKGRRFLIVPNDEAGLLMEEFNLMLDSLERSMGAAIHTEKMNVWQDIARKLAHELKNPLTPIKLSAERVLKRYSQEPDRIGEILEKSMMAIIQEVLTMDNLLTEFRDFSRLPEPQPDWLPLLEIVSESVMLFSAPFPALQFNIENIPQNLSIQADRGYLRQIFKNLILNAAEASNGTCRITISSDLVKTADSLYCRIRVQDDGPGIPDEIAHKVFSPYFTTKEHGTGLGLVIVEHAVTSHGGTIRMETQQGFGTAFIIDLPMKTDQDVQDNA